MRKTVGIVTEWAASVGFSIAPAKSKLMHCCRQRHRKRGRAININSIPIPQVRKIKILGIMVDSKLNFKQHLATIKKSCSSRINILRILGSRLKRSNRSTLLSAGSALIFSKLFYGLGLTSTNTEDMEQMLGPTYNEVVRLSSGAFVSSPTTSIMAEAGCLPFRLALTLRLAKLAVRLLEKDLLSSKYPVVSRAKDIFQQTTGYSLPNICITLRNTDREWYTLPPRIDNFFRNSVKAGTNSRIVIPMFQDFTTNRYRHYVKSFTDGSKDGSFIRVGVVMDEKEENYSLPDECSIFSAEAHALLTAVSKVNGNHSTIIFTDSASCIDALRGGRSKHPWIQSVERLSKDRNITFCWIPGHCGITGNERADSLAKSARNKHKLNTPLPSQDVKMALKRSVWSTWESEWRQVQSQLRLIKCSPVKYPDRNNTSEQRTLTRLRIGHTRLTHSHLIDKTLPPICRFCGTQITIPHILIDCRGYSQQRVRCEITGSLSEILAHDAKKEANILQFLKDCNIYNQI